MVNAVVAGVLVGARSFRYDGFRDGRGRDVPAGESCYVQIAPAGEFPAPVVEVKVKGAERDTLIGFGFGAEVELSVRAFGRKGGRVEWVAAEIVSVNERAAA